MTDDASNAGLTSREARRYRPPSTFDGLVLSGLAGRGGMGSVYVARDVTLDRTVAVKLVDDARGADERERVLHEARMLARLSHPNVVAVYRLGEVEGHPYIAYEHLEGTPLDQLDVPLTTAQALRVGIGLARGLAAVHARGVLHRDVKPANAVLTVGGDVKLIDFGIAKSFDESALLLMAGASEATETDSGEVPVRSARGANTWDRGPTEVLPGAPERPVDPLRSGTWPGTVVGTPRYLAPERWAGAAASAESDVFAFGVVLYELVAGRLGQGDLPSLAREGLPRLGARAPGVPEELAALIDACVAARAGDRPTSMVAVRDRLEAMAIDDRGPPGPASHGAAPEIRYTRANDVNVAYSVSGGGRQTLLVVPPFVTNLDATWSWPELASFYRRLGEGRRLVLYDKRGTGLSDRVGLGGLDARLADIRAVMDASETERAILFGVSEGVTTAVAWAALHPERTEAIVLYGGAPRGSQSPEYPAAPSPAMFEAVAQLFETQWGGPLLVEVEAPSVANDETFRRRWSNFLRVSSSPAAAREVLMVSRDLDVSHLLSAVRVPTLVVHREGDRLMPADAARALAARIPGAELALLPGEDHMPMVGDTASLVATVHRFLARAHETTALPAARIGTFVALRVSDEGALRSDDVRETWRTLATQARAQGLEERSSVPMVLSVQGLLAGVTFACELTAAMAARGAAVSAGVVTGDIERHASDEASEAHLRRARELAEVAPSGQVLVSRGLADLLAGAGVTLEETSTDAFRAR